MTQPEPRYANTARFHSRARELRLMPDRDLMACVKRTDRSEAPWVPLGLALYWVTVHGRATTDRELREYFAVACNAREAVALVREYEMRLSQCSVTLVNVVRAQ
jgi:hypothetical protein